LGCRCCCHVTQTNAVLQSVRSGEKFSGMLVARSCLTR
jgi:hypothetical protein